MAWIARLVLGFVLLLLLFSFPPPLGSWNQISVVAAAASPPCYPRHNSSTYQPEVLALQNLFKQWNSPDIATSLPGWNSTLNPCGNQSAAIAAWDGVVCEFNTTLCMNTVLSLQLVGTNLNGTLSQSIGNLTHLRILNIAGNPNLTGSLPQEIGNLTGLVILELNDNNFTMPLPDLSNLNNLQTLDLSGNSLEGTIPAWIGSLTLLQRVDLSGNKFQGNISFASNGSNAASYNLSYVVEISLGDNNLSGLLPDLDIFRSLRKLNLSNNQFMGPLPHSLGSLNQLTLLDLSHNNLSGTFPPTMANLTSLQQLDMESNDLTGPFPAELIWGFQNLQLVDFANNKFNESLDLTNTTSKLNTSVLEVLSLVNNSITNVLFPSSVSSSYADHLSNDILLRGNPYCEGDLQEGIQRQICHLDQSDSSMAVNRNSNKKTDTIIIAVLGVVVVLLPAIFMTILWQMWKRVSSFQGIQQEFATEQVQPTLYSYNQLKIATRDFHPDNKLGESGFGVVYKGALSDKSEVCAKLLTTSVQGVAEFLNEVVLLTGIRHQNLVKLKGCCLNESQRIVVYEFVENRNLAEALWDAPSNSNFELDWQTRFNICLGIAQGLAYLHDKSQPCIVHGDVKAQNILLDKNLNPRIGDFGLAHLFPDEKSHLTTVQVAGTLPGYFSPEYATNGQLTEKVDVYGFGVLVLEIVSGRKNTDFTLPKENVYLVEWAWKLHEDGRVLDLVEMKLQDMPIKEELKRVVNIALLCIQSAPSKRPTMSNVVAMLSGDKIAEEASRRSDFTKDDDFESLVVNVIPSNGLTTVNEDSPLLVGLPTSSTTSTGILQLGRMISRK
ncbi:unnamed protein product [Sphagnum troendelagicum]|uniref:Protein kinase domain-containing protein n=1 Tax=Sphagnum troendelagicum TaxID=128251 RepID=A0ABP0U988_9BRYO